MSNLVTYQCNDSIAQITINNPPVNALSQAVRKGIVDCIDQFSGDVAASIVVLHGSGRLFLGGADISEFGKPPQAPGLPDVVNHIEACNKPVIAAMHGAALGGGLEIAMGAHYRLATMGTQLGMPEVKIGLIPGATGTQRLPRLVGVDFALKMITSGQPATCDDALQSGLIDKLVSMSDVHTAGVEFAKQILAGDFVDTHADASMVRRTGDRQVLGVGNEGMLQWRRRLESKARGEVAALKALDAVELSTQLELHKGIAQERRIFSELMETPQRAGLIHAFFAERRVGKLPEIEGVKGRSVSQIGVIGGGTMGAGIATSALLSGFSVVLIERDAESVDRARTTIENNLEGAVKRGKLSKAECQEILSNNLQTVTTYSSLSQADLIIEAVFESIEVKKEVFEKLDAIAKPGAILATNTSYLDIDEIAMVTNRPESVIGLHFFSPAHVMKLLEVVVAKKTHPELVATSFEFAKRLGKTAVKAGVCDGFIGNRILTNYRTAADHMVLDGASPYQIDRALTDYGFAMGPYAVADLAGLDIGYASRQRRAPTAHPRERYPIFADEIHSLGRLGQKTGQGYYLYQEGSRKGLEDPVVEAIIVQARADAGIKPRIFCDDEIVRRYMAAMINEAARVLEEGIALRPLDIDVVLLYGYGFPRWRGGPMHTADQIGLPGILSDIQSFALEDDYFWQAAPLLTRLVEESLDFNSLNTARTLHQQ
ncbi:MAG: 3-hydroxyacyl-CoA dehydrogenase [bacterium]